MCTIAMRSQSTIRKILHYLHILHNFLRLWLLELVTVFARRLRIQHIVGMAQPVSLRLSRFIKYESAAGIADATAIKTQVF